MKFFSDFFQKISFRNKMSSKLLCAAIKTGDDKKVLKYMKSAEEPFSVESDGETIPTLHFAVEHDISEGCKCVKAIINSGANIERYRYQDQETPNDDYVPLVGKGDCSALAYAVLHKNMKAVKILLEADADPNGGKKNTHLENPMVYAACLDSDDDCEKFLDKLVSWFGIYEVKELIKIVKGDCNSTKAMKKKLEKYDDDFPFFEGDKKSRVALLKHLDEVYKETIKPLSYYEQLPEEEFEKLKSLEETNSSEDSVEEVPKKSKKTKSSEKVSKKKRSKKSKQKESDDHDLAEDDMVMEEEE